jgi:hypothetical protein
MREAFVYLLEEYLFNQAWLLIEWFEEGEELVEAMNLALPQELAPLVEVTAVVLTPGQPGLPELAVQYELLLEEE